MHLNADSQMGLVFPATFIAFVTGSLEQANRRLLEDLQKTTPAFTGKNSHLKSKYLEMRASKHCRNIPLLPNNTEFH